VVTITEASERETVRGRSTEEILTNIRAKEPKKATDNILVLRRLPSNDYHVTTLTEDSRIELEKTTDWLQAFAKTAEVKRTTFAVFAHGIRVKAVNDSNQAQAIETIRYQNSRLHPELEIAKVT